MPQALKRSEKQGSNLFENLFFAPLYRTQYCRSMAAARIGKARRSRANSIRQQNATNRQMPQALKRSEKQGSNLFENLFFAPLYRTQYCRSMAAARIGKARRSRANSIRQQNATNRQNAAGIEAERKAGVELVREPVFRSVLSYAVLPVDG